MKLLVQAPPTDVQLDDTLRPTTEDVKGNLSRRKERERERSCSAAVMDTTGVQECSCTPLLGQSGFELRCRKGGLNEAFFFLLFLLWEGSFFLLMLQSNNKPFFPVTPPSPPPMLHGKTVFPNFHLL